MRSTLIISKYTIFLVSNEEVKPTPKAPSIDEDRLTTSKAAGKLLVDIQLEMENTTKISPSTTIGDHLMADSPTNHSSLNYGINHTHGNIDLLAIPDNTTSLPTTKSKTSTVGPEENGYETMKVTATLIVNETNAVQVDGEIEKPGTFSMGCEYR